MLWTLGLAAAVLATLALGAFRRPSPAAPAPPPTPVPAPADPGRETLARERGDLEALARRLDERQRALEAREAASAPARPKPAPEAKPPSEDEKARAHLLATGGKLGAAMQRVLAAMQEQPGDAAQGNTSAVGRMRIAMDLLSAMSEFRRQPERMQGDLAADTLFTGLDQLMPEDRKLTEDQKARFRNAYAAAERQVETYEVPRPELFFSILGGWGSTLNDTQRGQVLQTHQALRGETEGILDLDQKAHLDRLLAGWSLNLSW